MLRRLVTAPDLSASISPPSLLVAARKVGVALLFGVVPVTFVALGVYAEARLGLLGFDFKGTVWHPARELLAGHSPYPRPVAAELNTGNPSVYPPPALVLGLPFGLLPFTVAYAAWTTLLVAAVLATLRLLGVRDWRCYTIALGSCPVVFGLALGNVVILVVLLAACAWRYRDNAHAAGLAVGLGIALKLLLWPLAVWFLATRRWRAAVVAAASASVTTFAAWAAIGFDGFTSYPKLLAVNNDVYSTHSWSLVAGAVGLGIPKGVGSALVSLLGLALLGCTFVLARRADGDRRAFTLAMVVSVAALPIVWPASLAVMLVALALYAPTLDRLWLLFTLLWVAALLPHSFADTGPPPGGVPELVWKMQHSAPPTAEIGAFALLIGLLTVLQLRVRHLEE
jgi:glycosyl transferase family 87